MRPRRLLSRTDLDRVRGADRSLSDWVVALATALVACTAVFWPVWFGGATSSAAALAWSPLPLAGPDAARLGEAELAFAAACISAGEWPAWFPFRGLGHDLSAQAWPAILHPFRLVLLGGWPNDGDFDRLHALRLGAAAVGAFWLVRLRVSRRGQSADVGSSQAAAFVAGIGFALAGPICRHLALPYLDGASLLPLSLLALSHATRVRSVGAWSLWVLAVGYLLTGGGAAVAIAAWVTWVGWVAWGWRERDPAERRASYGTAVLLAALVHGMTFSLWGRLDAVSVDGGEPLRAVLALAIPGSRAGGDGAFGHTVGLAVWALAAYACLSVRGAFAGWWAIGRVAALLWWTSQVDHPALACLGVPLALWLAVQAGTGFDRLFASGRLDGAGFARWCVAGAVGSSLILTAPTDWPDRLGSEASARPGWAAAERFGSARGGRILGPAEGLGSTPAASARWQLHDVRPPRAERLGSESSPQSRWAELWSRLAIAAHADASSAKPLLDLANVTVDVRSTGSGAPTQAVDRPSALSIGFFPVGIEGVESADEAWRRLAASNFDPRAVAFLQADDDGLGSKAPARGVASVKRRSRGPGTGSGFEMGVQSATPSYLFLSVPPDSAVQVLVDGEAIDWVPANGLGIAVWVPSGRHRVAVRYGSGPWPGLGWGLLGLVGIGILLWRRGKSAAGD